MYSTLAAERAEMLRVIEHLERVVDGLQREDAGVLKYADELRRLREQILRVQSPGKWQVVVEGGCDLIARIAVEVLKLWL